MLAQSSAREFEELAITFHEVQTTRHFTKRVNTRPYALRALHSLFGLAVAQIFVKQNNKQWVISRVQS